MLLCTVCYVGTRGEGHTAPGGGRSNLVQHLTAVRHPMQDSRQGVHAGQLCCHQTNGILVRHC